MFNINIIIILIVYCMLIKFYRYKFYVVFIRLFGIYKILTININAVKWQTSICLEEKLKINCT